VVHGTLFGISGTFSGRLGVIAFGFIAPFHKWSPGHNTEGSSLASSKGDSFYRAYLRYVFATLTICNSIIAFKALSHYETFTEILLKWY